MPAKIHLKYIIFVGGLINSSCLLVTVFFENGSACVRLFGYKKHLWSGNVEADRP